MGEIRAIDIIREERVKLVDQILKNMEKGYIFTPAQWNRAAMQPQNPLTQVFYKGGNKFKLMYAAIANEYDDPRWMTARQIRAAGFKILPEGKHSAVLLEKWIFDKEETRINKETGKKEKVRVKLDMPRVSFFTVFNGKYVDGLISYREQHQKIGENFEMADKLIATSECSVKEVAQPKAFYNVQNDEIILPPRATFLNADAFFSVAAHEMSHSTGHPSRLNRDLTNSFGSEEYAKEELRAELGALFMESNLGIEIKEEHFQSHTNYLHSWMNVLKENPNELYRAARDADAIAERLTNNYCKKYHLKREVKPVPTFGDPNRKRTRKAVR